jgi:filamentous hemagglutinin family protein
VRINHLFLRILVSSCFTAIAFAAPTIAQITPDATLPSPSIIQSENNKTTITGGTTVRNHLFHSFGEFSVPSGTTAYFNNNLGIQNIFTRVTGGNVSTIEGLIQANGTANLFLLNPNGILFGPNARLEIGGSFVVSTGDRFVFDTGEFSATDPQAPPLLTINVKPGLQPGREGIAIVNQANLAVPQDLTLDADQLQLEGSLQAGQNLTLNSANPVLSKGASLSLEAGGEINFTG